MSGESGGGVMRVGTRGSALALTQTGHVAEAVRSLAGLPEEAVELVRVRTEGDRSTASLASLGGTGVFVAALREALLEDRCDVAVHSLKDLPTMPAEGLTVAAVPRRVDPRDVLCTRDGLTLAELPRGARVGTGSPRRAAQLRTMRHDLDVVDIRGNVDTRLGRLEADLDGVVLAAAGLLRLGRLDPSFHVMPADVMLPAPGQGALAVEVRTADLATTAAWMAGVRALDDLPTRLAVTAERELLSALEAGCAAPIGALARVVGGQLRLDAVVCRPDGGAQLRSTLVVPLTADPGTADDDARAALVTTARDLGRRTAEDLLRDGAAELAPLGGPATSPPEEGRLP